MKLPALIKRLIEYRYWRRRGYSRRRAWATARNTM